MNKARRVTKRTACRICLERSGRIMVQMGPIYKTEITAASKEEFYQKVRDIEAIFGTRYYRYAIFWRLDINE